MSESIESTTHLPAWSITETWSAVALFLGTVISRVPFRSHVLYHWDSVNFAYAMRRFDVIAEQPQPPGYIAYVDDVTQLRVGLAHALQRNRAD